MSSYVDPHHIQDDAHIGTAASRCGAAVGFVLGCALIMALAIWSLRSNDNPGSSAGLLAAVPSESSFETAVINALRGLDDNRPPGEPTAVSIEAWEGKYQSAGVAAARAALAGQTAPPRITQVHGDLIGALDRYNVALGAAKSCLSGTPDGCRPQLDDLRSAAHDIDRLAGDLRLYLFG